MFQLKRYRRSILFLICLVSLFTLLLGCNNQEQSQHQNKQHNKFGFIDKNDIISFKVNNIKLEQKEIKNKSDRDKIIDLLNSVHITTSDIESVTGIGYGVIITYSNGQKFSANFGGDTMVYSTANNNGTTCKVDKDISDDLKNFYDNN